MKFQYGIDHMTYDVAISIASGATKGVLTAAAKSAVEASRGKVEVMANSDKAIYGINTGFGPLCETQISPAETNQLQYNLLISHAVGVGDPIEKQISKLMLICKVHALCLGYSGVRIKLIEQIIFYIEHDMIPVVPEQGSVGASGDLAPLSHLFLPLLGEGEFWINDQIVPAKEVLTMKDIDPIQLKAKEGLALINGTQFILANAIYGLDQMKYLLDLADVSGTMSLEGYQGSSAPFKSALHDLRPFSGNLIVAARIRRLLDGSQNVSSHSNCKRVQDPYSVRCMPQVHGASRTAFNHLKELVNIELNAVTDNPIILSDTEAISGGNFHGQPLAMAIDYTCIAAAELGNISDRRCYLLLEGKYGLPKLLTEYGGLHSGMMIPQYTTAALVTENKSLCFPPSADSVPTSLGQEDHVSMGSISSRKFLKVVNNLSKILAIELMHAAQAIDFRRPNTFSELIEKNFTIIRSVVPKLEYDRLLKQDINALVDMVNQRSFDVAC